MTIRGAAIMDDVNMQWRALISGENHILLAEELGRFFLQVVNIGLKSSIVANKDTVTRILKNKRLDDLSDVTWLCTELKFKIVPNYYDRASFVNFDGLLFKLVKFGEIDADPDLLLLIDKSRQVGACVKGIKYIRNIDAHCHRAISGSYFILFVVSNIVFFSDILELEKTDRGKLLMQQAISLLQGQHCHNNEIMCENFSNKESLVCDLKSTSMPDDEDLEASDVEEELSFLSKNEAKTELFKLAQFMRKIFQTKGVTIQKQDNLLKPAIVQLVLEKKITSVLALKNNPIFKEFVEENDLIDEQLSSFEEELESILQRIDFSE